VTLVSELLDPEALERQVAEKLISRKESGDGRVLYDYSQVCQFRHHWTPETRACRGLVTDMVGNVLARPFPKFHNVGEHDSPNLPDLPKLPFEVYDKLDGSLIIAYNQPNGTTAMHTRGSFTSSQSLDAENWMALHHPYLTIPEGQTWCFEWIGPSNRIVVDYPENDLVLLGVRDNATGEDLDHEDVDWKGRVVKRFAFDSLEAILAAERAGAEGYVIRFSDGTRAKAKGAEYVRLHRLLTGVTARTIWGLLASGGRLDQIVDQVPDEFYNWVRDTATSLIHAHAEVVAHARREFSAATNELGLELLTVVGRGLDPERRKAFAAIAAQSDARPYLFAILDGKPIHPMAWQQIKPAADRPFMENDE